MEIICLYWYNYEYEQIITNNLEESIVSVVIPAFDDTRKKRKKEGKRKDLHDEDKIVQHAILAGR